MLIGFAAYFSLTTGSAGSETENWWLIIVTSLAMAIGNFFAALFVPKFKSILEKRTKSKNIKKENN